MLGRGRGIGVVGEEEGEEEEEALLAPLRGGSPACHLGRVHFRPVVYATAVRPELRVLAPRENLNKIYGINQKP